MKLIPSQLCLGLWLLAGEAIAASTGLYPTRFDGVTWDNTNWKILNTVLDQGHYQSRISLANGYWGINLAAIGPFMDYDISEAGDNINGWPLFDRRQSFATISGFWDYQERTNGTNFESLLQYGGESVISGVPHWAGLLIEVDGHLLNATVDASQISNFSSSLDIRNGLMTWKYVWTPSQGKSLDVEYNMLVHKLDINKAAVKLSITPSIDMNVTLIDVLDGDCAQRTDLIDKAFDKATASIFSAVSPNGVPNVKAYIYSVLTGDEASLQTLAESTDGPYLGTNKSSIAQTVQARLTGQQSSEFIKYIGGASTDAYPDTQNIAKKAALSASQAGWDSLAASHAAEWSEVMPKDSVDNYSLPEGVLPQDPEIIELQILAVTNPFHLIQNTVGANAIALAQNNTELGHNSIQVGGLASESYAGFIFWDADVWMAPSLVISNPDAAKQISDYRSKALDQAKENVLGAFASSKNATGLFSEGGAVYPWTDSRFHNCTATGPCFDYEYHLNGDIGLAFLNYYITTGDAQYFKEHYLPVYDAIAWFFAEVLTYNATSDLYDLYNATDPDEYANHVDNPGFTMVMIKTHLETANTLRERFGIAPNETWTERSQKINIPVNADANIILEYSAMNGSISVKQADVVLIDDLLNIHNPYALSELDYYAEKQSPNGPGMTYGVFSIVANEISASGCSSYTYDRYGSEPYVRAPWFQYSEQLLDNYEANGGTHPAYPFLTGMGGAHRTTPYGYLGLRLKLDSFDISPNLPPQLTYIRYRTIYWQGHPISAVSNITHTTLTRLSHSLPNANSEFLTSPIPVTMLNNATKPLGLSPNGTLVVPNRLIGYNATMDGNIAQCKPVSSPNTYQPGQFPSAAIDGAISTKWQPNFSNVTATLVVDLGVEGVGIPISGFTFDWAQKPPTSWSVEFASDSGFADRLGVANASKVDISIVYDAAAEVKITAYVSNSTNVTLTPTILSTRYVRLNMTGNQGDDSEEGATVAEFTVLREGGGRLIPNDVVGLDIFNASALIGSM